MATGILGKGSEVMKYTEEIITRGGHELDMTIASELAEAMNRQVETSFREYTEGHPAESIPEPVIRELIAPFTGGDVGSIIGALIMKADMDRNRREILEFERDQGRQGLEADISRLNRSVEVLSALAHRIERTYQIH